MIFVESDIVIVKRKWYNLTKIYENYTYYMIFGASKGEYTALKLYFNGELETLPELIPGFFQAYQKETSEGMMI